jgi:hypothetical protein
MALIAREWRSLLRLVLAVMMIMMIVIKEPAISWHTNELLWILSWEVRNRLLMVACFHSSVRLTDRGGPYACETSRLPCFLKKSAHRWRWGCQPYFSRASSPRKIPGTRFCYRLSRLQVHSAALNTCAKRKILRHVQIVSCLCHITATNSVRCECGRPLTNVSIPA